MPTEPVLALAARLLAHRPTAAEHAAWTRPPYPTPVTLREDATAVEALLDAAVPDFADRPTALRSLTDLRPLTEKFRLFRRAGTRFDVDDAVAFLVATRQLSPTDVEDLVARGLAERVSLGGWRREVVLTHLWAGDTGAATLAAAAMGDLAYSGYRDIGSVHAGRGDATAFFALWRRYEAGRDRNRMDRLKQELVQAVASRDGWAPAVSLTGDKRLGRRYSAAAFAPWAASGDVEGLLEVFANDAADVLDELDELGVLVRALVAAAPHEPLTDVGGLTEVLARLRAVDPTTDTPTMRRRDHLFPACTPPSAKSPH